MCWAASSRRCRAVVTDLQGQTGLRTELAGGLERVGSWRWHVGAQHPVIGTVPWGALAMLTAQHFREGEEDQKLLSLA